jgi:hypothetical protein
MTLRQTPYISLPLPSVDVRVPETSLGFPPVRHEPVSLYMSCVNAGCRDRLRFDADFFILTFCGWFFLNP